MSNFVPTHVSIGGVKARLNKDGWYSLEGLSYVGNCGVSCSEKEAALLFKPLPKPVMVEIPLDAAKEIARMDPLPESPSPFDFLTDAIARAEKEAKDV